MKTAIFIDGANVFHHINKYNIRINFKKLIAALLDDKDELVGAHYFNASSGQEGLDVFFKRLSQDGIQLHISPIYIPEGMSNADRQQKGVDVSLAVVAMASEQSYDKIIVVSGDADFKPLADALKMKGKHVSFACFNNTLSPQLSEYCVLELDTLIKLPGISWKKIIDDDVQKDVI